MTDTTCELSVSMITDNMITESVTLNLIGIDLDTFMRFYYENFTDLMQSFVKNAKKTNIHLFNLAEQSKGLNLSLSISTDYEKDVSFYLPII